MSELTDGFEGIDLEEYIAATETIEVIFPKITERRANLSMVGVNARTYNHWRLIGLVGEMAIDGEPKQWVKLNIYDFVWLKIIQALREFGIPLDTIKSLREELDVNFIAEVINELDDYAQFLREQSKVSEERIKQEINNIKILANTIQDLEPEDKHLVSVLGSLIHKILLTGSDAYIVIYKSQEGFGFGTYTFSNINDFSKFYSEWFKVPHLTIPLANIIDHFMQEPKNEVNLEVWGFINKNEKKVLDAIRNNEYKEITITKVNGEESPIIEVLSIGNITEEKAKDIRRLLGLNQYEEITLKYRNDKNLYFKNKKRI
jgi:DNA-binding transcriptional MerR regulator